MKIVDDYSGDFHTPSRIIILYDATKNPSKDEFRLIVHRIRMCGEILRPGDTITILGVLHKILHPMGYRMQVTPDNFLGTSHIRAMKEEVSKKVDLYVGMLQRSAEECESIGVDIEVRIAAGTPMQKVSIQAIENSNAAWVILDRHLRKEARFYLQHISCKVALVLDNLSLDIFLRPSSSKKETPLNEAKFYSQSKVVPIPPARENENEHYSAYMNHLESSGTISSSFFSSFTSNSTDCRFSYQEELVPNPRLEEAHVRNSFYVEMLNR